MTERAASLQIWLWVFCGIAIAAVVVMAGPHLLAESTHAARPFGGVALRSLVWIVLAFAAYWALVRAPQASHPRSALASGRAPSRGDR